MSKESTKHNCSVCDQPSDLTCKICMKVNYCNRDHQKIHWKSHKPECFPAAIAFDDKVGRHLVATRDIQQGEIIFKEKPLISGPLGKPDGLPVCLTCFKSVSSNNVCSSCSWPVCGSECEKAASHAKYECEIFKRKRIPPVQSDTTLYEKIIVLRGILEKSRNPSIWNKIQQLQTHSDVRQENPVSLQMLEQCCAFIRVACGLNDLVDKDVDQVLGAIIVNAFVSDDSASSAELFRNGSYLFYLASMPAHDCTPNSSWVIQTNCEFTLRASVAIKSGESITQLYSQPTAGTQERQVHLRQSKFFDCTCKRCLDPTELGTYFSAIKCPVCPAGYLLLIDPTEVPSTNWKCDNDKCARIIPDTFVEDVLERIRCDLEKLQNKSDDSNSGQLKSLGLIEKLLQNHQGKTVHPNHYSMHTLENELLQRMSFVLSSSYLQNGNEKDNIADRMAQVARKNIDIADVIWPGFNRHRGRLLYFLQQGLLIPLNRIAAQKRAKKLPENKLSELKSIFEEVLQIRNTVHAILNIEPEGREESFIAKMMTDNSEEMLNLRKVFKS